MAKRTYDLIKKFNDAALKQQRREGWLDAMRDFQELRKKTQQWRLGCSGHPLDGLTEEQAKDYAWAEYAEMQEPMRRFLESADRGYIFLVSDRFYQESYNSAINRAQEDKFDDRKVGYDSFWYELTQFLEEHIDESNRRYGGIEWHCYDAIPRELAACIRMKALCGHILNGDSADAAFDKTFTATAPRSWFPPTALTNVLPDEKRHEADILENKRNQLNDNAIWLYASCFNYKQYGMGENFSAGDIERNRNFIAFWLTAFIHEYDRALPHLWPPEKPEELKSLIDLIAKNLDLDLAELRTREPRHELPLHPSWVLASAFKERGYFLDRVGLRELPLTRLPRAFRIVDPPQP